MGVRDAAIDTEPILKKIPFQKGGKINFFRHLFSFLATWNKRDSARCLQLLTDYHFLGCGFLTLCIKKNEDETGSGHIAGRLNIIP